MAGRAVFTGVKAATSPLAAAEMAGRRVAAVEQDFAPDAAISLPGRPLIPYRTATDRAMTARLAKKTAGAKLRDRAFCGSEVFSGLSGPEVIRGRLFQKRAIGGTR